MFEVSRPVEVAVGIWSVAVLVGTLVAIPVFVVKIPEDYFVRPPPRDHAAVRVLRTIVGLALIGLGSFMLVLPGQGILTIIVGLGVLPLPAARRLMQRLLSLPRVRDATNRMRARHGKPPLMIPEHQPSFA
jgi:hypothetical protein